VEWRIAAPSGVLLARLQRCDLHNSIPASRTAPDFARNAAVCGEAALWLRLSGNPGFAGMLEL